MEARALICSADQQFSLQAVELPEPRPDQVVLRTLWSGVSIGTEFAFVRGRIDNGGYPLCTGYMATGVVEFAGADTSGFAPGDRVYFRRNEVMTAADGTSVALRSGTHASHAVCAAVEVAPLPAGAPEDVASAFVMPGVGLHGVDISNPRLGDTVLVIGVGLVGLAAVAWSNLRGCEVVAADLDQKRLEVAQALGASHTIDVANQDLRGELERIAPGGADVVIEATGMPENIDAAIAATRLGGKFVWQGHYGREPVSFDFLVAHARRVQMFFPRNDGEEPARRASLRAIAMGALQWHRTITHRVSAEEAPGLYARINAGTDDGVIGAVIHWSDAS